MPRQKGSVGNTKTRRGTFTTYNARLYEIRDEQIKQLGKTTSPFVKSNTEFTKNRIRINGSSQQQEMGELETPPSAFPVIKQEISSSCSQSPPTHTLSYSWENVDFLFYYRFYSCYIMFTANSSFLLLPFLELKRFNSDVSVYSWYPAFRTTHRVHLLFFPF